MFPSCWCSLSVPFHAAVVHEWGELFYWPVECHGHAWAFLLHSRHCVSVSRPHHLCQFQVLLDLLGWRGEEKIFDVSSPRWACFPILPHFEIIANAIVSASSRHSLVGIKLHLLSAPSWWSILEKFLAVFLLVRTELREMVRNWGEPYNLWKCTCAWLLAMETVLPKPEYRMRKTSLESPLKSNVYSMW